MAAERSLLDLYHDLDKEALIQQVFELVESDRIIPVSDLVSILEDALDIELVALIIETFLRRIDDVADQLVMHYSATSDVVKRHIIQILSQSLNSKRMQFLLSEYFENPYMRPLIRRGCFQEKTFLFMNLVRFYEDVPHTFDNVTVAQQILKTIPRSVVIKAGMAFSGTRLMDVYLAIPPEDRQK